MDKIGKANDAKRLLTDQELSLVSGAIQDSEEIPAPSSRLVIFGFNPQPDPPGRLVGY